MITLSIVELVIHGTLLVAIVALGVLFLNDKLGGHVDSN